MLLIHGRCRINGSSYDYDLIVKNWKTTQMSNYELNISGDGEEVVEGEVGVGSSLRQVRESQM